MKFNWKRTLLCSLAFGWISLFWGVYDSLIQDINYSTFGFSALDYGSLYHGIIIAADNILGLFLLPLFGRLSDKTSSRFGKRKPFIIIGTIVSMVGFLAVCVFASLGETYFIPYIIFLMITLAAMASYRSPALALVPDLNVDELRGPANVVSNVVSVVLTALSLLYYYVFTMFDGYYAIGGAIVGTTVVMLIWFCCTVKENQFIEEAAREKAASLEDNAIVENNAVSSEETSASLVFNQTETPSTEDSLILVNEDIFLEKVDDALVFSDDSFFLKDEGSKKEVTNLNRDKHVNRILVLFVVFCFYMAYNALASNFKTYAQYIWGFASNEAILPLVVAQISAMASFPFASVVANKIGRKYTMIVGFAVMVFAFIVNFLLTERHPILYVLFILVGVGFGFVMVNLYPFFLETTKEEDIGSDTGIFATSMTLAMAITPILSGLFISISSDWFGGGDNAGFRVLFPYCMVFLSLSFVVMFFIKSKRENSKKANMLRIDDK